MEDKEVKLSIYGNISEILKWLKVNKSIPINHNEFRAWLEKQNEWLSKNYEYLGNTNIDLIRNDGVQYIKRNVINSDWIYNLNEDNAGLKYEIGIPSEASEIAKLVENEEIFPTHSILLKKVRCSKTKEDYLLSNTSKILDSDVVMIIEECELLGFHWTDKKYH